MIRECTISVHIKNINVSYKDPRQRVIHRLAKIEELPRRDQVARLRTIDAFPTRSV